MLPIVAAVSLLVTAAVPERPASADDGGPPAAGEPWRLELKRAMTNRGAPDQRSKTTLRVEKLVDSVVTLLRLDVPYVDKNNSFTSDPLDAGLGDLKARVGFRAPGSGGVRLAPFLEVVFPTANPAALGMGKYQLGPGITVEVPVPHPWPEAGFTLAFRPLAEQYFSVAGDPARAAVNYTQLEAKLEAAWPARALLSVNPKALVDWTKDGETAAVLELEGTWLVSRAWRLWLKAGARLWGPALPGTYDRQLESGARLTL